MEREIKELRVKIDGLAQLTKELKPDSFYKLDLAKIPNGFTVNSWISVFKESEFTLIDSFNKTDNNEPIVESIPQIYREVEKATDSLYLAKAWLGKLLGELGTATPYVNDGKRKEVKDIEPTQDVHKGIPHLLEKGNWNTEYNHIEKVDWLRTEIEKIIVDLTKWYTHTPTPTREFAIARTNSYTHLCEARFQLGFELERLKNNKK
jgi:hypothetical protein